MKVKCKNCGREFQIYPYKLKVGRGKYCSKKCKNEGIKKEKILRTCLECGKLFWIYPSDEKRGRGIFCSKRCRGDWMKRTHEGFKGLHPFSQTLKTCEICGENFLVKKYEKETKRFCSNKCRHIWHKAYFTGERNHFWKGGFPAVADKRNTIEYQEWRSNVFQRDNYICQICGYRGKKLNAHHKESWKDHEGKRFDLENGIILCATCHREVHRGNLFV